jgi:hypothetical protein
MGRTFKYIKGLIRNRKDRQYNSQQKNDEWANNKTKIVRREPYKNRMWIQVFRKGRLH